MKIGLVKEPYFTGISAVKYICVHAFQMCCPLCVKFQTNLPHWVLFSMWISWNSALGRPYVSYHHKCSYLLVYHETVRLESEERRGDVRVLRHRLHHLQSCCSWRSGVRMRPMLVKPQMGHLICHNFHWTCWCWNRDCRGNNRRLVACTVCYGHVFGWLFSSLISGFGGLEAACWPLVPKFVGSNPAEAVGFFRAKKSSARLPSEGK